ncbi:hypothetical protein [Actomonas aquatica]|uniref:Glycosyltransferase RgtA/B/C/D-like domain-containing protein n=1 Tax=Actomonas aquatica TaxID=2866162 RepID=A0ABZ1CCQ0_9BACT|nr:hypothetical protein [Opitutus sp. WL0086]WRQ88080.1 hypothetical protein K1X11_001590 [Opitutus sp. WL0086]
MRRSPSILLRPELAIGCVTLLAVIRLVGLIDANAVDVLYQDQWDLLRPLFAGEGAWTSFTWQHGPHRQGLGGLLQWWLYPLTGWNVRAESWSCLAVLLAASAIAVAVSQRLTKRLGWPAVLLPVIILSPVYWETMLLTPNIAHGLMPLLLVMVLAWGWAGEGSRRDVVVLVLGGFCAQFTGFGFCVALVSAALATWFCIFPSAEGWTRARAGFVVVAYLATVAVFMVGYRWDPAVPGWQFPVADWWNYPRFVALMFSSLLGLRSMAWWALLPGVVVVVMVIAALGQALMTLATPRGRVVGVLAGTSLVFAAFTAVGRLPVNIEAAFMWRYLPLLATGCCALVMALGFPALRERRLLPQIVTAIVVLFAVRVWFNFVPEGYAAAIAEAKREWVAAYLETRDMKMANERSGYFVMRADPESALIQSRLEWLAERELSLFRGR